MTRDGEYSHSISANEWWDAVRGGRLLLLRCDACDTRWLPWVAACPQCGGREACTEQATGFGTIYSWATVYERHDASEPPRTIAAVKLDEGPLLFGRVHITNRELEPGMAVAAVFVENESGTLVEFEPVSQDGRARRETRRAGQRRRADGRPRP